MSTRFCHHVNPAGVFCGGPPINKRDYCFWHLHETGRRMKAARARARSERVIINLPVLDDLHAVQVGLMQLAEAIAHGEIDHHSGRLMLSVLRLAASNLKSSEGWRQKADFETIGIDANIVIEEPRFEHQYGLPGDFKLNLAPEEAFPPPKSTVAAATPPPAKPASGASPASTGQAAHRRPPHSDHSHGHQQKRTRSVVSEKPNISPAAVTSANQVLNPPRKPPQPDASTAAPQGFRTAKGGA
jgi:hypothetical protein